MIDREFTRGFVKLYALWKASQGEVYGLQIIDEMREFGFKVSPGTLYPVLHSLLEEKDVVLTDRIVNGRVRKFYRATAKGRREAEEVIERLSFLLTNVFSAKRRRGDAHGSPERIEDGARHSLD